MEGYSTKHTGSSSKMSSGAGQLILSELCTQKRSAVRGSGWKEQGWSCVTNCADVATLAVTEVQYGLATATQQNEQTRLGIN